MPYHSTVNGRPPFTFGKLANESYVRVAVDRGCDDLEPGQTRVWVSELGDMG